MLTNLVAPTVLNTSGKEVPRASIDAPCGHITHQTNFTYVKRCIQEKLIRVELTIATSGARKRQPANFPETSMSATQRHIHTKHTKKVTQNKCANEGLEQSGIVLTV